MNGKGGTGKTTVSALMIEALCRRKAGSILAIDADPNSSLPEALGAGSVATIVGIVEDIARQMDRLPAGMTKERYIESEIQDAITEGERYDLLAMGRPEGPGCYCYVNNLLREMIAKLVRGYDVVVIDNAAGMEHISRRTARVIDRLVLVSDSSANGLRSSRRIARLAAELGIKVGASSLIVNKAAAITAAVQREIDATALALAGVIPYSDDLERISIAGKPVSEIKDSAVTDAIDAALDTIMDEHTPARGGGSHGTGSGERKILR